jgi:hypothetical protein
MEQVDLSKFDAMPFSDAERVSAVDQLVAGNYVGGLSLLIAGSNYWFGENFQLTNSNPPRWRMRIGNYNGSWQVHGYWIFRPTIWQCWQAYNYGSPFRYWNADGTQHEPNDLPQDWELFKFELANASQGTVRIRQARSGSYVGMNGDTFNLDAGQFVTKAAVFQCAFWRASFGLGASTAMKDDLKLEDVVTA